MAVDGGEAGTGGSASGSATVPETQVRQEKRAQLKTAISAGPYSDKDSTEMTIGHELMFAMPALFFPLCFGPNMIEAYEEKLASKQFTHFAMLGTDVGIYNLSNYSSNQIGTTADLVTSKNANNFTATLIINAANAGAKTTHLTKMAHRDGLPALPAWFYDQLNNFTETLDWQELVKINYTMSPSEGLTNWQNFTQPNPPCTIRKVKVRKHTTASGPRSLVPGLFYDTAGTDTMKIWEKNQVLNKASFQDISMSTFFNSGYRELYSQAEYDVMKDRKVNYSAGGSDMKYGADRKACVFHGFNTNDDINTQGRNEGLRPNETKCRNLGMLKYTSPTAPVDWKVPVPKGHIPMIPYFYHVYVNITTGKLHSCWIDQSRYIDQTEHPIPGGHAHDIFAWKPYYIGINNYKEDPGDASTIRGSWACMDFGSHFNPYKKSSDYGTTYINDRGPDREYKFYCNSMQIDSEGKPIQEVQSNIVEFNSSMMFYRNDSSCTIDPEKYGSLTPGLDNAVQENYIIPPLKEHQTADQRVAVRTDPGGNFNALSFDYKVFIPLAL